MQRHAVYLICIMIKSECFCIVIKHNVAQKAIFRVFSSFTELITLKTVAREWEMRGSLK